MLGRISKGMVLLGGKGSVAHQDRLDLKPKRTVPTNEPTLLLALPRLQLALGPIVGIAEG